MSLTFDSSIDKKGSTLLGVAEYFEKVGKLAQAKYTYKKAIESPKSTDIERANARLGMSELDKKIRGSKDNDLVNIISMIPTKDLKDGGYIDMPIGYQDFNRLKNSISESGIMVPLLVDTKNGIICGKNRWKIAKSLEIKECPCIVTGVTDPIKLKETAIADNLCRRQLSNKEKTEYVNALLRLRKETAATIKGPKPLSSADRKKAGKKIDGLMSNREIAKMAGVDDKTVGNLERKLEPAEIPQVASTKAKSVNITREQIKDQLTKGKNKSRDMTFSRDFSEKIKTTIDHIMEQLEDKEVLKVSVTFEYSENE